MGNQICCEDHRREGQGDNTITITKQIQPEQEVFQESVEIPELSVPIQKHVEQQKLLLELPEQERKVIRYGDDVYVGQIDQAGRPTGYGRMYHKNGSFFIGEFKEGFADGEGHYVRPDGSYYHGNFSNNIANDNHGYYWTPYFEYRGGIKNNTLEGKAYEKSNHHEFEGIYEHGQKVKGVLKWTEDKQYFRYEGQLNSDGKPHGFGKLIQPSKGEYQGEFVNGKKHGKGQFRFKSGTVYIGEYKNNLKDGKGKILKPNKSIAYDGDFSHGMPHGKGITIENGNPIETTWIEGIDARKL